MKSKASSALGKAKKDDDIALGNDISINETRATSDASERDEISALEFEVDNLEEVPVQKPGPLQRVSRGVAR